MTDAESTQGANTVKKRQHYVPRFYLKAFGNNDQASHKGSGRGKSICLYNTVNKKLITNASIGDQAYKPFFYGKDGVIEDKLGSIESLSAPFIKGIIEQEELPRQDTEAYRRTMSFAFLMKYRTPGSVTGVEEGWKYVRSVITGIDRAAMKGVGDASNNELLSISLSIVSHALRHCSDLTCKILINQTSTPFITSDNPMVAYNAFLSDRWRDFASDAIASRGIILLLPLSPRIMLVYYDAWVYKVGGE